MGAFAKLKSLLAILALMPVSQTVAGPTMALNPVGGPHPVQTNDLVQVVLSMSDLGANEIGGFQAFLAFDPTKLQLLNGMYQAVPFGLPIVSPISANAQGEIDLAAGINQVSGQTATSADAMLVLLEFRSLVSACDIPPVRFRAHNPPTRLTTVGGAPVSLTTLVNMATPCPEDFDGNAVVNVVDLLTVINHWGACPGNQACCPGDGNSSANVNVNDLLLVVNNWGACP